MTDLDAIALSIALAAWFPSLVLGLCLAWRFVRTVIVFRRSKPAIREVEEIRHDDLVLHLRIPAEVKV